MKLPVSRVFTPTAAPALRQGHSKFCPTAAAPGFQTKECTDTSYSSIAAVSRLPSKGNQAALQVKCTPMLYPSRGGIGKSRDANHGDQMRVYTNTETKTSHFSKHCVATFQKWKPLKNFDLEWRKAIWEFWKVYFTRRIWCVLLWRPLLFCLELSSIQSLLWYEKQINFQNKP